MTQLLPRDPANPDWCQIDHGCAAEYGHDGPCDLTAALGPGDCGRCARCTARPAATDLLAQLRIANPARCARWHDAETEQWSLADWSNAMCGEAGEAANVVKKIRRHETRTGAANLPPLKELRAQLAHEIADTVLYAHLLAHFAGIDFERAIVEKFNLVSERQGFPERLSR